MAKYKIISIFVLTVIFSLCISLMFSNNSFASDKIKIEAVGFFTHSPMKKTKETIEEVCGKFEDQIELTLYDETKPEGEKFMSEKGLSGHIPMRLYINGENKVTIDGKTVSFSDFVNNKWTAKDLERAIALVLEGTDISAVNQQNKTDNDGANSNYSIVIIAILIVVVIIAVIVIGVLKNKKKGKK